jgi:sterol desaturase/sphingolipid hydroxylase (fatty acid hydroxylase superfamily)
MSSAVSDIVSSIALILLVMAVLAVVELAIPLRARSSRNAAHLRPNLALTFTTFAVSGVLNAFVVAQLVWLQAKGWGLLNVLTVPPWLAITAVVLALDVSFYVSHVAMHKVPMFWRVHRVHHSDMVVDVTTTIRQHPAEGLIRYASLLVFASALGASPAAFAIYRVALAVNALLEHANIQLPQRLDTALSWITTWPNAHKVHHSRNPLETDSNYGNLFSWWDRMFSTFTPSSHGAAVVAGLDGFDEPEQQTTAGLLAMPFAGPSERERERLSASS